MKNSIFTLYFSLNLIFSFSIQSGIALAQAKFEVPAGFLMQKVHRAFKETGTEFDWYLISNSSIGFFIYDMSQNSGFSPRVQKRYDRNLEKYSALLAEYGQIIPQFNSWLLTNGVDALDRSLKQMPVQFVIDPMIDLTETNALFTFNQLEHHQKPDWWVKVWMEPVKDLDFLTGYPPVMIHELGHFIFRSFLETAELIPPDHGYLVFTLGPLDEAFADAVSYGFTGEAVVGQRYDYTQQKTVEFRHALSSVASDRLKVRTGTWNYKEGDPHTQGEAFRDVLIEIGEQHGYASMFVAIKQIQKELLRPDSCLLALTTNRSEENTFFNQVIPKVLAEYPLR